MEPRIIGIYGASGSGKNYILEKLKKSFGFVETISDTTRKQRDGEIDGDSYNFRTPETFVFDDMAEYTSYAGNYYGTSKKELESKLKKHGIVFVVMESQGLANIKQLYGDVLKTIYITVDEDTMQKRMKIRGDSDLNINKRIENAKNIGELKNQKIANLIVEGDWDKSKDAIIDFIFKGTKDEIEKKYIVDIDKLKESKIDLEDSPFDDIKQGYQESNVEEVRVRSYNNIRFEKTTKRNTSDPSIRKEENVPIDKDLFDSEYSNLSDTISKRRHYVLHKCPSVNRIYKGEVDVIEKFPFVIAEFEFFNKDDMEKFIPPLWCVKDVTSDKSFKNRAIAKSI